MVGHKSHKHNFVMLVSQGRDLLGLMIATAGESRHLSHQHHIIVLPLAILYEALAPVQVPDHRALELCRRPHLRESVILGRGMTFRYTARVHACGCGVPTPAEGLVSAPCMRVVGVQSRARQDSQAAGASPSLLLAS